MSVVDSTDDTKNDEEDSSSIDSFALECAKVPPYRYAEAITQLFRLGASNMNQRERLEPGAAIQHPLPQVSNNYSLQVHRHDRPSYLSILYSLSPCRVLLIVVTLTTRYHYSIGTTHLYQLSMDLREVATMATSSLEQQQVRIQMFSSNLKQHRLRSPRSKI